MVARFLIFLSCLFSAGYNLAQSGIEANVLNYNDLSQVERFEKLEIGIKLPDSLLTLVNNFVLKVNVPPSKKINPFLQWELDVEAQMTHVETGTVKKIPAFYYREYERDEANNTWKEIGTTYPMRIRFAPPLAGEWSCKIKVAVKNKLFPGPQNISFTVIPGDNKGFISVHPNKRNLMLDGEIIVPAGTNFPSPLRGEGVAVYHTGPNGDIFPPNKTFMATKLSGWLTYHNDIENYGKAGGRFIRTIQTGWASLLEFEEKGNYFNRQHYAWEQDRLLEYCEKNGMYIHFNMMEQEPFMMYGNYDMFDWDWSHYNSDKSYFAGDIYPAYCYNDRKDKLPSDAFSSEEDLRFHEQRIRYYIARYGYSTSVYLFELLSEAYHMDEFATHPVPFMQDTEEGRKVRSAIQKYHEDIAVYIKQQLGHTNQLVGIDFFTDKIYDGDTYMDQAMYHPDIDVIGVNLYSKLPSKMIIAKSGENNSIESNENSLARVVSIVADRSGKPVVISEGGPGDMVDDCSGFVQQSLDMMSFGFIGLAGFNSWVGWDNGQHAHWDMVVNSDHFLNSPTVLKVLNNENGYWVQGRQAERHVGRNQEKAKETQYYVSQNQNSAVGYVKNRTYNFYTKRISGDSYCSEIELKEPLNTLRDIKWTDGNKYLVVEGLDRSKKYEVTWYDYRTGQLIETEKEIQKLKRGKLRLHFPELSVTEGKPLRPEVWFTVKAVE